MTVLARRIASVPRRSPVETWTRIVELIAEPGSPAHAELESITSPAAMLLAEERAKEAPIVISGSGPQVRIYTLHDEEAIEHDFDDETPFASWPASRSWTLSLPALADEVAPVAAAIAGAAHVEVRDVAVSEAAAAAEMARDKPGPPVIEFDLQGLG